MRLLFFLASFLWLTGSVTHLTQPKQHQEQCVVTEDTLLGEVVYQFVDEMPEYPGGIEAAYTFFANHFNYPNQQDFQATILVEFIVSAEGEITRLKVTDKEQHDLSAAEEEALKVIKLMPHWNVGRCSGKAVPVRVYFPIRL